MEQSRTEMEKKERTPWKGGKQFHANKGWTIGECSGFLPSLCRSATLPISEPGHSFSAGTKQEGGSFLFFFLCRLLNALWSIPKRLILFRERFPISLLLFNNSSSLFMVWSQLWKDYLNPGCIWIISLWSTPSRELHQPSSVYWKQINTRTHIHRQLGHWDYNTKRQCIYLDVQETGKVKSAVQQMELFCCGVSAVCHSCAAPDPYVLPKIHSPTVEACTNKDGSSERDFLHHWLKNVSFRSSISQHWWNKNMFRSSCNKQVNLLVFLIKLLAGREERTRVMKLQNNTSVCIRRGYDTTSMHAQTARLHS